MLIKEDRFPVKDILKYGFFPSCIKKIIYRLKGYKIGKQVSLGIGSVICGDNVEVGDYTELGFFTIVRGKNIKIGSFVSIGSTTVIDTPILEIGDGTRINEQVFVGGLQFPDSKLIIGRNCQIMQMSFINPAKSITIGDDTGIGGDCLLFGHTSWLSQFEGYPVSFRPIEIGKSVSLSWRVFVLAGSTIGDGTVIGANSLVNRKIPSKCLAVGFPAKVVSKYPYFPRKLNEGDKVKILKNIMNEMTKFFSDSGLQCEELASDSYEVIQDRKRFWGSGRKTWKMKVVYEEVPDKKNFYSSEDFNVLLSLRRIPQIVREELTARKVMWIDIEKKEQPLFWNDLGDEVTFFLKRYGVRLFRVLN